MRIYCDSYRFVVSGLPDNCIVEFFGKIDKEQFFIIISLESGEKKAYLGPAQDMKEIKVDSFTVHGRGKPVVVETEMGKFFFPAVCDWHKEIATFNCRVIEIIPWTERIN
ncbi:MAG: hypothetical protein AUK17_00150 [Parcubacteria group bacterium CG2_30_44_18]|nr:MAG: hypothetical protein AUK17_00150 [Parcubacteria group bacterium CG2_30_44_18]